jgi:hypothetical protein
VRKHGAFGRGAAGSSESPEAESRGWCWQESPPSRASRLTALNLDDTGRRVALFPNLAFANARRSAEFIRRSYELARGTTLEG